MHDQLKMYIKYMTTENVDLIHDELKKYINTLNWSDLQRKYS